jgi:beta-N-acetylhexosaminidase
MQLEHRTGQLMIIGLPGGVIDSATREFLQMIQPGGVLLTDRNIETAQQVSELTSSLRSSLAVPPILAIDQEGGRVDRLKEVFSPLPSPDLLRAANDAVIAARQGEITAETLRALGFNVNFAPVLDIAVDDAADNGLKGRYLGDSVAEVVRLAGAYLEGLQHGGVTGVGKHFPGLGASRLDSHSNLPIVDGAREDIMKRDIAPYTELFSKINARLSAVMVSHAHYPAFDGSSALPASLSKNVVTGLLREEIGFKGLVMTDDLEMGAITSTRPVAQAAIEAIEAGHDMVMVTGSMESAVAVWQAMTEAARDGRITKAQIRRAFDHIARIKSMLSPPHTLNEGAISRLRERVAELNLILQHAK